MKLSAQVRYAVRILFTLDTAGTGLPIAALAVKTGMSVRAVETVLTVLKRHGVTGATAGPGGGIFLKTPLSRVSVGHLVDYFEDGVNITVCCGESSEACSSREDACGTEKAFQGVSRRICELLHQAYLSDILHKL